MLVNQPYEPISIVRFEQSLLSLGAALDRAAESSRESSANALMEVQKLTSHLQGKV